MYGDVGFFPQKSGRMSGSFTQRNSTGNDDRDNVVEEIDSDEGRMGGRESGKGRTWMWKECV